MKTQRLAQLIIEARDQTSSIFEAIELAKELYWLEYPEDRPNEEFDA